MSFNLLRNCFALGLVCAQLTAPWLPAENLEPIPVEELVSAPSFTEDPPNLSPNGRWLAYTVQDPRKINHFNADQAPYSDFGPAARYGSDVWITDIVSRDSKNITEGKGASWGPVWSPDGRCIAFYSTRSGQVNIWTYEPKFGQLRQISDVVARPLELQTVRWTPDSRHILSKIAAQNAAKVSNASKEIGNRDENPANASTVTLYQSLARKHPPGSVGDSELVEDSRMIAEEADLALIDVNASAVDRIAMGFRPDWYDVSPDGSQLAFASWKGLRGGSRHRNTFDLVLIDRQQSPRVIASDIPRAGWGFAASWSPDGRWLAYVAMTTYAEGEPYVVATRQASPPRKLISQPHPAFNNFTGVAPLWDAASSVLYFVSSLDGVWTASIAGNTLAELSHLSGQRIMSIVDSAMPWDSDTYLVVTSVDSRSLAYGFLGINLANGQTRDLLRESKVYKPKHILCSHEAKGLVYVAEDASHGPDFWFVGPNSNNPRRITALNAALDRYTMGKSRLIAWQDLDGATIQGAVLLPSGYEEGKRYPVIVNVYGGGSLSVNLNCFGLNPDSGYGPENKQLFATRGYAILSPDAPLGEATPMRDLLKTVLPGVNKLVEMGIADPERLGVMGASYGAYSALGLAVQTTRFKAAILVAGFGDLIGFSGEMESDGASLGGVIEEPWWTGGRMPGPPWAARPAYVENSPIFYVDRLKTPVLIVHGSSDRNVATFLSDEIFVFLRRLGTEVVYAKYRGEGHVKLVNISNQIDLSNRMIAWFDAHLKNSNAASNTL